MVDNVGECALCKTVRPLMNSHIIPEFLYRLLYDQKGRASLLSTIPEQRNRIVQSGIKERLLCGECEIRISKWERYASLVLMGGIELEMVRCGNGFYISGIDYLKFRLFQLSIIWRAGVSRDKFFKYVRLGPHAEILRNALISEDVGSPKRYGCFMFGLRFSGKAFTDVISQPVRINSCGVKAYKFVFGGFVWVFHVSSQDMEKPYSEGILRSDGRLFFIVKDALQMLDMKDTANRLRKMNRLPRQDL